MRAIICNACFQILAVLTACIFPLNLQAKLYKPGEVAPAEFEITGATMQPLPSTHKSLLPVLFGCNVSVPDKDATEYEVVVKKAGVLLVTGGNIDGELRKKGFLHDTILTAENWKHVAYLYSQDPKPFYIDLFRKIVKPGDKFRVATSVERPFVVVSPSVRNAAWVANLPEMDSSKSYPFAVPWERGPFDPVDILKVIDPHRDRIIGGFNIDPDTGALIEHEDNSKHERVVVLPCKFPREYDLEITLTRKSGIGALQVGLTGGSCQFVACVGDRRGSGMRAIGHKDVDYSKWNKAKAMPAGKQVTLTIQVRSESVRCYTGGGLLFEYEGSLANLGAEDWWTKRRVNTQPFLRWVDTQLIFHRVVMLPHIGPPPPFNNEKFLRKWTNNRGDSLRPATGRFVKMQDNAVVIQTIDGAETTKAIWDLSKADQDYVRRISGEGPTTDIPAENLQKIKDATVMFMTTFEKRFPAQPEGGYRERGAGLLIKKTGNKGLIAVSMRRLLKYAMSRGMNDLPDKIEVVFNVGEADEKTYPARLASRRMYDFTKHDQVIYLQVTGTDLPDPIAVSSTTPQDGDTVYTVGFPTRGRYTSFGTTLGPEIIAMKMPLTLANEPKQPVFVAQSDFSVEPSAAVVDAEGKLLGITLFFNCVGHATGHGKWVSKFPVIR